MSTPTGLVLAPTCRPITPRRLGSFQITAQIASGRRAEIYLGHRDGEPSAPLRLRTPKPGHDARAFTREAQRVIAFGGPGSPAGVEEEDRAVVAWGPPVVGESLAVVLDAIITDKVPMPIELAITVAMGVAARLGKGAKHVHGDLVPHHLIVGYDGSIALIDAAGPEDAAERAAAPGRSGYRAPEHVKGEPIGAPADVFVLGALLYELTTATRLFVAPTSREVDAAILAGGYPRPRAVLGDHYPIELQVLLRKLLRAQPEGRFPDGEAALEGLRLAASVRAEGQEERVGEWMRSRFRDRFAAWSTVLSGLGVDMGEEPLDFDADPTENPDSFEQFLQAPPAGASGSGPALPAANGHDGAGPPAPPTSGVPWPVWSPPTAPPPPARSPAPLSGAALPLAARLPAPSGSPSRASTLPSPRPPPELAELADFGDLDEQTRPVGRNDFVGTPPDRLLTALDVRVDLRGGPDATDPFARALEDLGDTHTLDDAADEALRAPLADDAPEDEPSEDEPPRDARAIAASRERTVVSAPPEDPDEQTWVEPSPLRAADEREPTRTNATSVAWDLELPEDVDPEQTADDGDIPSLLDDADIQLLSGSEAATPLPRGAVPADLASDLLGEDFRRDRGRRGERNPSDDRDGGLDERAVPEPRKVRQRLDSTLADPSAAPTQVGAAATPMPESTGRRGPAPTAILDGLAPPPVRPAPAPLRREETVIVRQRNIPRDSGSDIDPDALGLVAPDATQPSVATLATEVSDADNADVEGLLVIPVADEEAAKKKPRLALWLALGALGLLGLAVAAWGLLAERTPAPPPPPTVRAVPAPSTPAPAPVEAAPAATPEAAPAASATVSSTVAPVVLEPEPEVEPTASPSPAAPAAMPAPEEAEEEEEDAPPAPEASRAPAPKRPRPTAAPPPPTPKGPVDIKVTAFPASAVLRVDGRDLPSGSKITVGKEPVIVTVSAEGYQEQMMELRQTSPKEVSVLLRRKK